MIWDWGLGIGDLGLEIGDFFVCGIKRGHQLVI